jgi:hypothetical protein
MQLAYGRGPEGCVEKSAGGSGVGRFFRLQQILLAFSTNLVEMLSQ